MAKSKKYITEDEAPESIVEEAAVHYETMRVVLGGNNLFSVPSFDDMDLIRLSRNGVRKSS